MSMSMKGTSSSAQACVLEESWPALRQAWNAGVGVKWRSSRPSETVKAALAEDGWLTQALLAIEALPKCRYFNDPVTLNQFCKPGFVDEVLGGKWNNPKRRKGDGLDFGDAAPPPRTWSGPEEDARRAMLAKTQKLKEEVAT